MHQNFLYSGGWKLLLTSLIKKAVPLQGLSYKKGRQRWKREHKEQQKQEWENRSERELEKRKQA